jgi:hypothetical protein
LVERVTLTVWMLKEPEEEAWQPDGGELCAKAAVAARARIAKDFIFRRRVDFIKR